MTTTSNVPSIPGLSTTLAAPAHEPLKADRQSKPADRHGWWWATGRRKTAVARVRLKPAQGNNAGVTVHVADGRTKTIDVYFTELRDRTDALEPLHITDTLNRFEIHLRITGGGTMGQAQAARLAIARALVDYDPSFYAAFRERGIMTRDAREVERKKYGQPGARRRFQFSKR